MEIIAVAKNIQQSPKKIRVVARKVSRLPLQEALGVLAHIQKKAAQPLYKVLQSAVANATHNQNVSVENLRIKEIEVGQAMMRRWPEFRARGRFNWRKSRSSHIRVVLEADEEEKKAETKASAKKQVSKEK
jgi:large subunit ribosomal protein L22